MTAVPIAKRREGFVEFRYSLPSCAALVSPFLQGLMPLVNRFRSSDGNEVDIELALHEALLNAVIHGNKEDPCKHVYLSFRCEADGEVWFTIKDEGAGFDSGSIPDPTAPGNLLCTHGRGICLMQALMDEVSFEEGGTVVRMRKSSLPAAPPLHEFGGVDFAQEYGCLTPLPALPAIPLNDPPGLLIPGYSSLPPSRV